MMTTKDGKRISKFSLEAMTIGEDVDRVSEITLRENHKGLFSANSDWPENDLGFIPASDRSSYLTYKQDGLPHPNYKQALFPTWAPLIEGEAYEFKNKDLRCYMTEIHYKQSWMPKAILHKT